jgi:menaquinone-dependent protoporphyrinogen oxidase
MTARILVAYATRKGSTAEIAHAVGKELVSAGHTVDVVEAKTIRTVEGYNAVVIGAPMYMGSIEGEAGKFVKRFSEHLAKLPIAAFAVGMAPVSKDAKQLEGGINALHASLAPLRPVAATMFAGRLDPTKLSFIQRKMTEFVKSPTGDFRDWNAIAAWARELPGKLGV